MRECNVCKLLRGISIPAVYDARIPLAGWADLCQTCFDNLGCKLGLGKGSKLIMARCEERESGGFQCELKAGHSGRHWISDETIKANTKPLMKKDYTR